MIHNKNLAKKFVFILCLFSLFFSSEVWSVIVKKEEVKAGPTLVEVGEAKTEKYKVGFIPHFKKGEMTSLQTEFAQVMENLLINDFAFYREYFDVPDLRNLSNKVNQEHEFGKPHFNYWQEKNITYTVESRFSVQSDGLLMDVIQYDINKKEKIHESSHFFTKESLREVGHRIANDLYEKVMKKRSMFNSKVLFVSDVNGNIKQPIKELYMVDFDGNNLRQLTHHRGIVISPSFSYDNRFVAYSVVKTGKLDNKNIDLHLMNLDTGEDKVISNRKGINSGAYFFPDGKNIVLTLSHLGNADLYVLNLETNAIRRLTNHIADDVDPSLSRDGQTLAFLSGRPGKAMIYTLNSQGEEKDVKRVSFIGRFNATPRFSPTRDEIVFSSWVDERFDIYRIDSSGEDIIRLTKNFGSNEDPSYSLDGQFIAFSSQRVLSRTEAIQDIYIMDRNGEILGPLTKNFGNCTSPRWSN